MACEVNKGRWLFRPFVETRRNKKNVPFMPTPLHDIESLPWMIIWSIAQRPMAGRAYIDPWQKELYGQMFIGEDKDTKKAFLEDPANSETMELIENGVEKHDSLDPVADLLEQLCAAIVKAHREYQTAMGQPSQGESPAYADNKIPKDVVRLLSQVQLPKDIPLHHEDGRKRKRPHSTEALPTKKIKAI